MRCQPCGGTGNAWGLRGNLCPLCKGDSEIPDPPPGARTCNPCGGTGLLNGLAGNLCSRCGGKAYIVPPAIKTESSMPTLAGFHKAVIDHALELYRQGEYALSTLEAAKAYNNSVKNKTQSNKDGQDLMFSAWSIDAGGLLLPSKGSPDTTKSFQEGIKFLSAGVMRAIRNPGAHEPAQGSGMTREECREVLGLISFLFRQLDRASPR